MPTTTQRIPEVDLLRIKCAHLEYQLAQQQVQQLSERRDALIRHTLLAFVEEEDLEQYVIDLEAGMVRRREPPGREEG